MKVYVLETYDGYESSFVLGAYTSREAAKEAYRKYKYKREYSHVSERELDAPATTVPDGDEA
jgi:hypothetical protein